MFDALRKRITFSNVVALLALFVALGGTAYAIKKINGRNLLANSVSGKKLKRNTLGGREINESKLGLVPHALKADEAGSLGGKTAADFAPAGVVLTSGLVKLSPGQEQTLLTTGPLTIRLTCKTEGPETVARILLRSSEAGSLDFGEPLTPNTDHVLVKSESPPAGKATSFAGTQLFTAGGLALESMSVTMVNRLGVPCAGVQRLIP
jgi:hypothetical protein